MPSLSSIISLAIWLAPWLLPRAMAFVRSIRASGRHDIRPVPAHVQRCLAVLFVVTIVFLAQTLAYFSPPNVYKQTNSRLAIPPKVLFTRVNALAAESPSAQVSSVEQAFKDRYSDSGNDFGLLYAAYGPDALAFCPFCSTADPDTYMLYAIPSILRPHLLHVLILGLATSSFFSGAEGIRWRAYATFAGVALAGVELVLLLRNDWKLNTTKRSLQEVDFFFWRVRTYRYICFALVDGLLGYALYLTSTNRWLARDGPPLVEQLAYATSQLQRVKGKILTMGQLRNTVVRDPELSAAAQSYWTREARVMEELEQRREVVDAKRMALSKMDIEKVRRSAAGWVEELWPLLKGVDVRARPKQD